MLCSFFLPKTLLSFSLYEEWVKLDLFFLQNSDMYFVQRGGNFSVVVNSKKYSAFTGQWFESSISAIITKSLRSLLELSMRVIKCNQDEDQNWFFELLSACTSSCS